LNKSELHFQEDEDGLKIHVPRDEEMQDLCFLDRIPTALLEWIMTEPSTGICKKMNDQAVSVMQKIIQARNKYVAITLTRAGIVSVETPDESINDQPNTTAPTLLRLAEGGDISTVAPRHRDQDRVTSIQDIRNTNQDDNLIEALNVEGATYITARASPGSSRTVNPRMFMQQWRTSDHLSSPSTGLGESYEIVDLEYLIILHNVVTRARRATFPSRGTFNMAAIVRSLNIVSTDAPGEYFGLRSSDKIERDKKIGAAGELFVRILMQLSSICVES
jgi:hypothetical protein